MGVRVDPALFGRCRCLFSLSSVLRLIFDSALHPCRVLNPQRRRCVGPS